MFTFYSIALLWIVLTCLELRVGLHNLVAALPLDQLAA